MKRLALLALTGVAITLTACGSGGSSGRSASITTPGTSLQFQNVVAMTNPRAFHTATRLQDGRVLVTGGQGASDVNDSAEIYDPSDGSWTSTPSMRSPRMNHVATLLPNGDVLLIGGQSDLNGQQALSSTEIYRVAQDRFEAGPSLSVARSCPTIIEYEVNGEARVLIAGGSRTLSGNPQALASTEIYNTANGNFTTGPQLNVPRFCARGVAHQGRLIIQGGWTGLGAGQTLRPADTEILDLSQGGFQLIATPEARAEASLTINAGQVLAVAGRTASTVASGTVENLNGSQWTANGANLVTTRWDHRAVSFNGELLIIGGRDDLDAIINTEIVSGSQVYGGASLVTARSAHTATPLQNGSFLITGGLNGANLPLSAVEVLAPSGQTVPNTTNVVPPAGQGGGSVTPGTGGAVPTVAQISPSSGPVGTSVTIQGVNFGATIADNEVTINGTQLVVTNASTTSLTVIVPNGTTTGPVQVTVAGNSGTGPTFTVTSSGGSNPGSGGSTGPAPDIIFVIPNSAATFVPVAITGRNFGSQPVARFNGTPSINIISLNLVNLPFIGTVQELVTIVPPGATTGQLRVEANGRLSNGVNFTVR